MPLKKVIAPRASLHKLTIWVSQRTERPDENQKLASYEETHPHRVFHASLGDIVADVGFSKAEQVAWRHIHTDAQGQHHALETRIGPAGQHHHLHEVHRGLMVDEMKDLALALEEKEELKDKEYELAYLRLFALKICAIWLRATHRPDDYFIPLSPCFYGLVPGQLYTYDGFLQITREAIKSFTANAMQLEADDMAGG